VVIPNGREFLTRWTNGRGELLIVALVGLSDSSVLHFHPKSGEGKVKEGERREQIGTSWGA